MDKWPDIEFTDDHDRSLFIATVHRKPFGELDLVVDSSGKSSVKANKTSVKRRGNIGNASGKILDACRENETITIPELASLIGITERSVERNIQSLRAKGLLRRVGGRKEGRWVVVE